MEQVVSWAALVGLIAYFYPEGKNGRPLFSLQIMLRIHLTQQWFTLSNLGMEEALFDTPLNREFVQLEDFGRHLRAGCRQSACIFMQGNHRDKAPAWTGVVTQRLSIN